MANDVRRRYGGGLRGGGWRTNSRRSTWRAWSGMGEANPGALGEGEMTAPF